MPARINHNPHLKQVHRHLAVHFQGADTQLEQAASGHRVNRSSDDPASLALANGIRSETRALVEGGRNVQQSIQMLQVAEGALSQISDIIRRLRELASQAASSTYNDTDRPGINSEFQSLKNEIERIAQFTTYNGVILLNSRVEFAIQAGPSETSNDVSRLLVGDMRPGPTGLNIEDMSIETVANAQGAMDRLKTAQDIVLDERNRIAAFQNRLQLSAATTASIVERMQGAEANVRDADVARALANLSRSQILTETASSLAREADVDLERILSLLQ
jgi:flagellin